VSDLGEESFRSAHTASFPQILRALGVSLVVSTYQSGRVIAVREDGGTLNTHFRAFDQPMGMAYAGGRLVIATHQSVWDYRDQPAVAPRVEPAGRHDACFLPRQQHVTGDVRIHEVFIGGGDIWMVNTLFSCLATIDAESSFVPRWRPPFVSALAPEDRCHLNGVAVVDGAPRLVTALGSTDDNAGWRADKAHGGVLVDVDSGRVVAGGMCMPHSPRIYGGRVWLLESGLGSLATVDDGSVTTVATMPGFTRGLAFADAFAFVGLSQVRESVFEGVPVAEQEERACGVWVVDLRNGEVAAFLRFEGIVEEVFDVQVIPRRYPEITEPDDPLAATSYVLPDAALADVPPPLRASGGS
jgi:uncharacterized protein (TIGR03032 family)